VFTVGKLTSPRGCARILPARAPGGPGPQDHYGALFLLGVPLANRELTAFLGQARQPYQSVTTPCVSMTDRLRQDQERAAAEERARQQAAEAAARQAEQTRERSVAEITEMRENRLALSVLLLVFSGAAGLATDRCRMPLSCVLCTSG